MIPTDIPSPTAGVLHLGPLPIRGYALCILLGIVVAIWLTDRRMRTRGGEPGQVLDVAAYAVVALVHLAAQLAGTQGLADLTQWAALPWLVLAVVVQTRLRSRLARLAALGLLWCWGGDTLPDLVPESLTFVALMGAFLVAHAFLVAGFWPFHAASLLRTRWVGAYAAAAVLMVLVCAPGAGALTAGVGAD